MYSVLIKIYIESGDIIGRALCDFCRLECIIRAGGDSGIMNIVSGC